MNNNPFLTLPEQKNFEQAYGLSLKLAVEKLSKLDDLDSLCRNSGSFCQGSESKKIITLDYLNKPCQILFPDILISQLDGGQPVELIDKILILHYLLQAKGTPLSNKLIAFQEFKEGAPYYPSFVKRSLKPLIEHFGQSPEILIELSKELGGYKSNMGDISVTIPAFARLPVTYVIWKGDEEFPANASILFDNTVLDYLPAEDVTVLCQTITWKLVKSLKSSRAAG